MKILVLQDYLRSGGTERQTVLLANAFAAAGHAVTLLTFRPGGSLTANVDPQVARFSLQSVDIGLDWFAPGLHRAVTAADPDVILCMGRMANCRAGSLQRRRPQTAVVATLRTGKPLPVLFRRSLGIVRHVVANSTDSADALITRYGVPADRISIIPNSLVFPERRQTSKMSRTDHPLRRSFGAGPETTVLLCVAMFRPEKNQRELIEISAGLPSETRWQLWLAGDGPARDACLALAEERGVADRVKFPGWVANPSELYAAADIAVHASWSESLSNFLIEAQAHGLPAVAYEARGIAECLVPDETGFVIARDDRAAFREAVHRLIGAGDSERSARAEQARSRARETFDPSRQAQAYLDLFARLTG